MELNGGGRVRRKEGTLFSLSRTGDNSVSVKTTGDRLGWGGKKTTKGKLDPGSATFDVEGHEYARSSQLGTHEKAVLVFGGGRITIKGFE